MVFMKKFIIIITITGLMSSMIYGNWLKFRSTMRDSSMKNRNGASAVNMRIKVRSDTVNKYFNTLPLAYKSLGAVSTILSSVIVIWIVLGAHIERYWLWAGPAFQLISIILLYFDPIAHYTDYTAVSEAEYQHIVNYLNNTRRDNILRSCYMGASTGITYVVSFILLFLLGLYAAAATLNSI